MRPWLIAAAFLICASAGLLAFAWSVQFDAPATLDGLAVGAHAVRLRGIAIALQTRRAELLRARVRRMRVTGASATALQTARWSLADALRDASIISREAGLDGVAETYMALAAQAAPERDDLRCLLIDLRSRELPPRQRRVELLRLVLEQDCACANMLAGESFMVAGDLEAAAPYLARAAELAPEWPRPHFALARLHLRRSDSDAALRSARAALDSSSGMRQRLAAAELIRRAGGNAPAAWRIVVEQLRDRWTPVGLLALGFLLFVFHPALLSGGRSLLCRVRRQFYNSDNAA